MDCADRPSKRSNAIAFVGSYLPRRCGIATFTYDLAEAVAGVPRNSDEVIVVAMNDREDGYDYPDRVTFQIHCDTPDDYTRAADYLNKHCRAVCLQHEFGIFGGTRGEAVLRLISKIQVPLVVTCHTVLKKPELREKQVFRGVVRQADQLIVMNKLAIPVLEEVYGARRSQIVYICHGIHDAPYADPPYRKKAFGVLGRVLFTFGLLHRNKGIETVIEAMQEIVRARSDTTYVIAGQTHPVVVREEGEAYRRELEQLVIDLGLENHIVFIDRFFDLSSLMTCLRETDVFVAPYLTLDHMTSGALSYAAGAGNAVVATPFLHARELLAENRGKIVPPADAAAIAHAVIDLLADQPAMDAMRRRIYAHTRGMVWPSIAREYLDVFDRMESRTSDRLTLPKRPDVPVAHRHNTITPS
jgi:glycosyltransferase involved in cell wall biosynthesis